MLRIRRVAAVLVGLAVAAASALAAPTLTVEVSNASANEAHWMEDFDTISIGLGDFDGDGRAEIVAYNDNEWLYVLSTKEPRVLAEIKPPGDGAPPNTAPVVADVDGDGILDIVVVTHSAHTCRYEYDPGASTATSFKFATRWCVRADRYDGSSANADGAPYLADVDRDGDLEIFMQTEQVGLFAWNADGTLRWSKQSTGGNAGPVVGDLDGDGDDEVVFFGDAGEVRAYDADTGTSKWSKTHAYEWPASIVVGGALGDLDDDGKLEIAFVERDAEDATDLDANHFVLVVLRPDGTLRWKAQPSWGNPMSYSHPVFADLDDDGDAEIVTEDWNTMGHKPGAWEPLGPANVFAYRGDGTLLWRTELDNGWSNDDVALADADGDGRQEVLAIGRNGGTDGIWLLNATTGAKETHVPASGWSAHRGPWAADLGDGDVGLVLGVRTASKGGGFRVYDTGVDCDVVFGGWQVHDPCDLPASSGEPPPPPPPPPPPGPFEATFSGLKGNAWWIEVDVEATTPLAGVDARVDGGAWKALALKSYGWAASIPAPDGSLVQFRARATSGEEDLSGCYRWTAATATSCDAVPPPPSGFDATFRNARGNMWWVEVDVDATGGTLAGIDARVDGGTWTALAKQSWGSWARSMKAPDGSAVEFRARATDGATDVSTSYVWPP